MRRARCTSLLAALALLLVGRAAQGAIAFHAVETNTATASTTLTITLAGGDVAAGDFCLAEIAVAGTPSITAPSADWGLIDVQTNAVAVKTSYYQNHGSCAAGAYTWTFGAAVTADGAIATYGGVELTFSIDVSAGTVTGLGTSHTAPSITTTVAGDMLVAVFSAASAGGWTPPSGMTERWDSALTGLTIEGSDVLLGAAGATGSKTGTVTIAGLGAAELIALLPQFTPTPTATVTATGTATSTATSTATATATSTASSTPADTTTPSPLPSGCCDLTGNTVDPGFGFAPSCLDNVIVQGNPPIESQADCDSIQSMFAVGGPGTFIATDCSNGNDPMGVCAAPAPTPPEADTGGPGGSDACLPRGGQNREIGGDVTLHCLHNLGDGGDNDPIATVPICQTALPTPTPTPNQTPTCAAASETHRIYKFGLCCTDQHADDCYGTPPVGASPTFTPKLCGLDSDCAGFNVRTACGGSSLSGAAAYNNAVGVTGTTYPPSFTTCGKNDGSDKDKNSSTSWAVKDNLWNYDTSNLGSIPNLNLAAFTLVVAGSNAGNADGRNLTIESHTWSTCSSSDYSATCGNNLFSHALVDYVGGPTQTFTASLSPANLNTSGSTGLRVCVDGGQPTGGNSITQTNSGVSLQVDFCQNPTATNTSTTPSPTPTAGAAGCQATASFTITPTMTPTPTGASTSTATRTATSTPTMTGATSTPTATATSTGTPAATNTSHAAVLTPMVGPDVTTLGDNGSVSPSNCVASRPNNTDPSEQLCAVRYNTASLAGCTVFGPITLQLTRNLAALQSADHYGFAIGWYSPAPATWTSANFQFAYDQDAYASNTDIAALFPSPGGSTTLSLSNGPPGFINTAGFTGLRMWLKDDTAPTGKNNVNFGFGNPPVLTVTCH